MTLPKKTPQPENVLGGFQLVSKAHGVSTLMVD